MKKLTRHLLVAGTVLTFACSCQCSPNSKDSCPKNLESTAQDPSDEDLDNGAYGDEDTSSSCGQGCLNVVEPEESFVESKELSNENSSLEPVVSAAIIEAATEMTVEAPIVLQAVTPVEIIAEHQVIQDQEDAVQN